ncbi:hypothetical protein AOE01nite_34120 [Acetobacter oeni]|uniref:Uncharacterized protein n=1 Tax=Acetobacter oeni TaxID=304077 RepID=A0A511XQE1_9PROT|nr:hypothetical protein AA21952_1936 [Acetobacter oeni LMG 21952]GEN65188.1 hypothetical protein AOE01nite_34120 [Acetobacter oeni]
MSRFETEDAIVHNVTNGDAAYNPSDIMKAAIQTRRARFLAGQAHASDVEVAGAKYMMNPVCVLNVIPHATQLCIYGFTDSHVNHENVISIAPHRVLSLQTPQTGDHRVP